MHTDGTHEQPQIDPQLQARAADRKHMLAAGLLALPNLFLRSALTLTLLYGMLGLLLVTAVQFDFVGPGVALALGIGIVLVQFIVGPWVMDLCLKFLYRMRWVQPDELPDHLRAFVARVCEQHRMRFPSFGVIDDGAPQAFTYGHHPGNARVVISRGLMELLTPAELEAVVAHELGHARNWDMALMTLANLVPLLAYFLYRVAISFSNDRNGAPAWLVAVGAYVVYIVGEYIVLWFSRTREYNADRFAGTATGQPNALASALVKIAYGLAAQDSKAHETEDAKQKDKKKEKKAVPAGVGALGALNIFDRRSAVNLVMNAAGSTASAEVDPERVKGAMQWDLWNPWATYYELHSTHPLVAKRLRYLGDQASSLGQEPYITFDRAQPKSYWGSFLVDLLVLALPWLGLAAGLALAGAAAVGMNQMRWGLLGIPVALLCLGALVRSIYSYRGRIFEHRTVASLLAHVEVSNVRPVPATVTGSIIGKGVPGLIWSEDFVMRDATGILFLDYKQPLDVWGWLFGLLRAERYQGKEVRVTGWFRRAPTPYLEIYKMEVVDGSQPPRTCYSYHANVIGCAVLTLVAAAATAWLFVAGV